MTNRQMEICEVIRKHKKLGQIIVKANVTDYIELQERLPVGALIFSDFDMTDETIVELSNELVEELENRQRASRTQKFTWFLSVCALIISFIALFRTTG